MRIQGISKHRSSSLGPPLILEKSPKTRRDAIGQVEGKEAETIFLTSGYCGFWMEDILHHFIGGLSHNIWGFQASNIVQDFCHPARDGQVFTAVPVDTTFHQQRCRFVVASEYRINMSIDFNLPTMA